MLTVPKYFDVDEVAFEEFVRCREKFGKRAKLKIDDNDDRYYAIHGPSGHIIGWSGGV